MPEQWRPTSFKLRLVLWYAAITGAVLSAFVVVQYEIVEHRLAAEVDRQLRIDFDLTEAQLQMDSDGKLKWHLYGAHGDEGFARLSAWFEVWSEQGELLLRHWPVPENLVKSALPAPRGTGLKFHTAELEDGVHARLMERPARIGHKGVIVRQFRDETAMRRTLQEIVEFYLLALPFALIAASLGGYWMARRALRPVGQMAARAKTITSKSLADRLPNPNPRDEFGQLAAVFNDTLQRLENSFSELQRFTADASHELRTPLTALRAAGELALREPKDAHQLRESIGSMLEESQRLDGLIDSLLTLARLEGGHLDIKSSSFDLVALCKEVIDTLQILAHDRKQALNLTGESQLEVASDRTLLRQALLNIVHNAIRHSQEGASVALQVYRSGGEALVAITDQGPGIARELQERIFQRFFRVDPARSESTGGYGLGLAIARESIEKLGGRIELDSVPSQGSTFRVVVSAANSE
jgi:heavy metal sensor kinase